MNRYLNIFFLIILLLVVFLARQPFTQQFWPNIYNQIVYNQMVKNSFERLTVIGRSFVLNVQNFILKLKTLINQEVKKRKEILSKEIAKELEKIFQKFSKFFKNFTQALKNFIFDLIVGTIKER